LIGRQEGMIISKVSLLETRPISESEKKIGKNSDELATNVYLDEY